MRAAFLFLPLALTACQSAAEKRAAEKGEIDVRGASMDEVAKLLRAARPKIDAQPGMWTSSMELESSDLADMPEAQRGQMERALQQQQRSSTRCAEAKDLRALNLEDLQKVAGTCTFPHFTLQGGKLDGEIRCEHGGQVTTVRQAGTMSPTGYDIVIDQTTGKQGQPGHAAFRLHTRGKRIGACVANG